MRVNWHKIKNKIPPKVKVRNRYYEVLWAVQLGEGNHIGETRFDKPQIIISKKLSPKQAVLCFFHEYLHAISFEYDANLTENQVLATEQSFVSLFNLMLELNS